MFYPKPSAERPSKILAFLIYPQPLFSRTATELFPVSCRGFRVSPAKKERMLRGLQISRKDTLQNMEKKYQQQSRGLRHNAFVLPHNLSYTWALVSFILLVPIGPLSILSYISCQAYISWINGICGCCFLFRGGLEYLLSIIPFLFKRLWGFWAWGFWYSPAPLYAPGPHSNLYTNLI